MDDDNFIQSLIGNAATKAGVGSKAEKQRLANRYEDVKNGKKIRSWDAFIFKMLSKGE